VSPLEDYIYVIGKNDEAGPQYGIRIIDTTIRQEVNRFYVSGTPTPNRPIGITMSSDNMRICLEYTNMSDLWIFSVPDLQAVEHHSNVRPAVAPLKVISGRHNGFKYRPSDNHLFVTSDGLINEYTEDGDLIQTIDTGESGLPGINFGPFNSVIYCSVNNVNTNHWLGVIAIDTYTGMKTAQVGTSPGYDFAVSLDGRKVYVLTWGEHKIRVYDTFNLLYLTVINKGYFTRTVQNIIGQW
jgi:hypothetical protein